MTKQEELHEALYLNLKIAGFQAYANFWGNKYAELRLDFNEAMFRKRNQAGFQLVSHFLVDLYGCPKTLESFRSCFPCRDKKQESDFKNTMKKFLDVLKNDPEASIIAWNLPIQSLLGTPGGDQFVHLYMTISNYMLTKRLSKNWAKLHSRTTFYATQNPSEFDTMMSENLSVFEGLREKRNSVFSEMHEKSKYFVEKNRELTQENGDLESNWSNLVRTISGKDLVCNADNYKLIQDFFKKKCFDLDSRQKRIQQNSEAISSALSDVSILLDSSKTSNVIDFDTGNTLSGLLRHFDQTLSAENTTLSTDLLDCNIEKRLSDICSKNKALEHVYKELQSIGTGLAGMEVDKKLEAKQVREVLLQDPAMQDRVKTIRRHFPKKLPKFLFGAKYADPRRKPRHRFVEQVKLVDKEQEKSTTPASTADDDNCSFNFGDLSALHYVAPQGADDSVIMTPPRFSTGISRDTALNLSAENAACLLSNSICD
ncbi:hypothetical protein HDE_02910 [Halotydeus destructor]|nr:hypothetical protein HDE_02910 [Halotydeus destructor]